MSGFELVAAHQVRSFLNNAFDPVALCPAGKKVMGGGYSTWRVTTGGIIEWFFIGDDGPSVSVSRATDDLSGWEVRGRRGCRLSVQGVRAYAICAYAP